MHPPPSTTPSVTAQSLTTAILLTAAVGTPPFLLASPPTPTLFLATLALLAPAAGAFACTIGLGRSKSLALLPPATWMILLALAQSLGARPVPNAVGAATAWTALYALGWGLASNLNPSRRTPTPTPTPTPTLERAFRLAGPILLVTTLISALPFLRILLPDLPIQPQHSAQLLNLSPLSLVLESAGIDWLRQPLVYEYSHGADISPLMRTPYSAVLAAPGALVVGCALVWIGKLRSRPSSRTTAELSE